MFSPKPYPHSGAVDWWMDCVTSEDVRPRIEATQNLISFYVCIYRKDVK